MYGIQWSIIYNKVRNMYGLQTAWINRTHNFGEIQNSLVCHSGEFSGVQVFWFYSETESFSGVQFGGFYAKAHYFYGFQRCFINCAENIDGVQIGFVNISKNMRGLQIGLVNIIKKSKLIPFMFGINFSW